MRRKLSFPYSLLATLTVLSCVQVLGLDETETRRREVTNQTKNPCTEPSNCETRACQFKTCTKVDGAVKGECGYGPLPNGPAMGEEDDLTDCIDKFCFEGVPKVEPDDSELPPFGLCEDALCVGGIALVQPRTGGPCEGDVGGTTGGPTGPGVCVQGVCTGCSEDYECGVPTECRISECVRQGGQSRCEDKPAPVGPPPGTVADLPSDCAIPVCTGGELVEFVFAPDQPPTMVDAECAAFCCDDPSCCPPEFLNEFFVCYPNEQGTCFDDEGKEGTCFRTDCVSL